MTRTYPFNYPCRVGCPQNLATSADLHADYSRILAIVNVVRGIQFPAKCSISAPCFITIGQVPGRKNASEVVQHMGHTYGQVRQCLWTVGRFWRFRPFGLSKVTNVKDPEMLPGAIF